LHRLRKGVMMATPRRKRKRRKTSARTKWRGKKDKVCNDNFFQLMTGDFKKKRRASRRAAGKPKKTTPSGPAPELESHAPYKRPLKPAQHGDRFAPGGEK